MHSMLLIHCFISSLFEIPQCTRLFWKKNINKFPKYLETLTKAPDDFLMMMLRLQFVKIIICFQQNSFWCVINVTPTISPTRLLLLWASSCAHIAEHCFFLVIGHLTKMWPAFIALQSRFIVCAATTALAVWGMRNGVNMLHFYLLWRKLCLYTGIASAL